MKTLGIIIVILSLFVAACTMQVSNSEPIKIGAIMALTGDTAVIGQPVADAVNLAVKEINDKGGINGRQVQVVTEDGGCDAGSATTAMQKLVSQDKVIAVIGAICSSATLAAAPIAEESGTVLISPTSTAAKVKDAGDYVFRVIASDSLQGKIGAQLAKHLGYNTAAVLNINNDYGNGLADVFVTEFTKLGGEVVLKEAYAAGETNFRTLITKAADANPDFIYFPTHPVEAGLFLKQKEELDNTIPVLGSEATKDQTVIDTAGTGAEGVYITFPKPAVGSPEYVTFEADYKAATGNDPGTFSAEGYDAAKILMWAVGNSDGTKDGVKDRLYKAGIYNGASGSFEFDSYGEVEKPYTVFVIENGQFVQHDELME